MRLNFSLFFSLITCSLFFISSIQAQNFTKSDSVWVSQMDSVIASEMEAWNIPGVAVSVIHKGNVLLQKGYGYADPRNEIPMDPEKTLLSMGSVSKPMTSTAILKLYDEGVIDLDQTIEDLAPELFINNETGISPTVADLLVHAGGLDRKNINRYAENIENLTPLNDYVRHQMPPIMYQPGSISIYSNHGYALLGYLISKSTGKDYNSYMKEEIFTPLGMTNSGFEAELVENDNMAVGHGFYQLGNTPVDHVYIKTSPASMLKSTVSDLTKWMTMVLNEGKLDTTTFISESVNNLMVSRQHSNHPLLNGRSYAMSESNRFYPHEYLHSGAVPGFTANMVLVPAADYGVIVSSNSSTYLWGITNRLLDRVDSLLTESEPELTLETKVIESPYRFAGSYREAGIAQHSMFKFGNWIRQTSVSMPEAGLIEWDGRNYEQVDTLAFQRSEGSSILAFGAENGSIEYLFAGGDQYVRVSWFENRILQAIVFLIILIGVLYGFVYGLILPLFKKEKNLRNWVRTGLGLSSLCYTLFLTALIYVAVSELAGESILTYGIPWWFSLAKGLLWAGMGISVATFAVMVFSKMDASSKIRLSTLAKFAITIGVLFIPYALYWNFI